MTIRKERVFALALISLVFVCSAFAKPKEKTFSAPPDKVFAALSKVIAKHHVITFADEKNMSISFHTGVSAASYGMNCTAIIESEGTNSKVSINTQKTNGQVLAWGAGDRIANDIFKWLEQELASSATTSNQ